VGLELSRGAVRSIGGVFCPRRVVGDGFTFFSSKISVGWKNSDYALQ
jgi:hypothetical protein